MHVRFLTPARRDLLRAVDYYVSEGAMEAADAFLGEVDDAGILLSEFPGLGTPAPNGTRRIRLHSFPYSLIYRIDDDAIRVFAIQHHSIHPTSWEERLQ